MKDEEYVLRQENREKSSIARSARSRRTHCGKGGRVKLPSDYMTKKELKAMNGEVEIYRLNSPMKWAEFKAMPDEHKVTYIKLLRNKWNVPDAQLATMFNVSTWAVCQEMKRLGLSLGAKKGRSSWDKEGFMVWLYGVPKVEETKAVDEPVVEEIPVAEEVVEEVKESIEDVKEVVCSMPTTGQLTFEGSVDEICNTLRTLLRGASVRMFLKWNLMEVEHG